MWSIDSLQNHVIREVALTGEEGISFSDVGSIIANFYSSQTSAKEEETFLRSTGLSPYPPSRKLSQYFRNNAFLAPTNPDRSLCEKVWDWLQSHPDILNRIYQSSEPLSLNSARPNVEKEACSPDCTLSRPHENYGPRPIRDNDESFLGHDRRIYGTESRIWQAIAGHGIDYQKIHALEFRLLSIISNRKNQGIVQPDLIKISGQDKRSVPKRTDKLQDYGYIIKRPVIWNGMRTSHCTLKAFAALSVADAKDGSDLKSVDCLDITKFLLELFTILQKAKVIPLSELRLAMGSSGHRRETKFLALAIRRLEILGCLKRVLAKVTDKPTEVIKWMQCVKYIKVPTDDEREALTTMTHDQEALIRACQQHDDQDLTSVTELHRLANSGNDLNDELSLQGQSMMKPNPCWTPYLSYFDLIYGSVEESGAKGISSMKLRDHIFGSFCKKPFDVIISRLTDDGRTSQPLSLQHLTLIKDTSFLDRVSHYTYRTYFNFKLAIESGEAAGEVLQTLKLSSPPENAALPRAADGGQLGLSRIYNDASLDSLRVTSVSTSIKLSGSTVNDRHGKRRPQLTLKNFNRATKAASKRRNSPRKRGRPRKRLPEKNVSQLKSCAFSNDNTQSQHNELQRLSSIDNSGKATSESLVPMSLDLRESQSDTTQLSEAPNVQEGSTKEPTKKRKRLSVNSCKAPMKAVKTGYHDQSQVRYDIRKSLNENLISAVEREEIYPTKTYTGFQEQSIIEHSSNYGGGQFNRGLSGICFRLQESQKHKGKKGADGSLIAIFRSEKLWQFDWFTENESQSSDSRSDYQRDMEYTHKNEYSAKTILSKQSDRMSPHLASTLLSEQSIRSNEAPTDFRTNLLRKVMPDQLRSMIVNPGVVKVNESQINNISLKPISGFRMAATANTETNPKSTARSLVDDIPTNLDHSSPESSDVNNALSTKPFVDHKVGNAESLVRTQENKKVVRNEDIALKDDDSAENQINNCPKSFIEHLKDSSAIRSEVDILSNKRKPHVASGSIAHQRTQIVLNLVQKCEGVFPGGSEICPSFSNLWKKLYGTTTDSRTIMRAVKDAIDCGKLRRVHFSFRSKDGIVVTRNVLTLVNIAPDSPTVRVLQRSMIDSFPKLYRPPQVEDNASSKSFAVTRHVFHKDLSCPAERQYRPLYLQKLEDHRALMAQKRLTRSLENHSSIRKKVQQKRDPTSYLTDGQQLLGFLTDSGIRRLSSLPRLSSLTSPRQMSLGKKTFSSSAVHIDKDSNIALKTRDHLSDKISALDILNICRRLQPTMKIDQSSSHMVKFIANFGLQKYLDGATTLLEPTQLFQPSTGTFTTEYSILRLKANFSKEELEESVQPALEKIMPQSVTEMRRSQTCFQSQQDESQVDRDYSKFSQEIKEVGIWERKNENLVSSDLKLRHARFINHTVPNMNCHDHSRPHSIDLTGIDSVSWLPPSTRLTLDSHKHMELQARQRKEDARYDRGLSRTNKSPLSSDYSNSSHALKTSILINLYQDTTYWPHIKGTQPTVSSVLDSFHLLSSSAQKPSLPANSSKSQPLARASDKWELENRSPPPEHNEVPKQVVDHARCTSSVLGARIPNDISAHVANVRKSTENIKTNKFKRRQNHRIRKKASLTDGDFPRRLLLTVSVIRILSGGIERLIDWNLVLKSSREFSQMTPSSLKRRWLLLKKSHYFGTDLDESRIQKALLIIYERGRAPSINFQDLRMCEWKVIVDMVHQILHHQERLSRENAHTEVAETQFSSTGVDQIQDVQAIRNEFNSQNTLQMRRDHLLTVLPFYEILYPIKPDEIAPNIAHENLQECKARCWVRANILTPSENYCPEAALEKLQQLGEERVTNALKFFEERNLVRETNNRTKNLRNLEMSDLFYANFRTSINISVLEDAATYKTYLDDWIMSNCSDSDKVELESSDEVNCSLSVDPASPSGAFLAITNLAANDRVTIHPRSLPLGIGFDDPSPTIFEYNLEIRPSSRYIRGNPLCTTRRKWPPAAPKLTESDATGKIPLWVDIHGNHLQRWWDRVRACVLNFIATRSGISINGMTHAMHGLMEYWEISAVVRWLIDVKAVKWLDDAFKEEGTSIESQLDRGLTTREWWWMAIA